MNWMDIVFLISGTIFTVGFLCLFVYCDIQMRWLLKHWSDGAT